LILYYVTAKGKYREDCIAVKQRYIVLVRGIIRVQRGMAEGAPFLAFFARSGLSMRMAVCNSNLL
jgi:hypothetical protein